MIMILVRVPFYFYGITTTQLDLNHMLIGESLANGATLYVDLWEGIAPLSAWFYMIIHFLFGKSIWAYHIIALIICFLQCIIFNKITLENKVFTENNYLPSVVYGILISVSYEMFTLTPALLSTTFILLALSSIFSQVEFRLKKDEPILSIGVYIGISALFCMQSAIFLLATIIVLGMFSSTVARRYLLIIYGFCLPFIFVGLFYFMKDDLSLLLRAFYHKMFTPDRIQYLDLNSTLILLTLPMVFLLISIVRIIQRSRFSNYQVRLIQLVLMWMFVSFLVLIWSDITLTNFILFAPASAFLITHYFNLIKGRIKTEIIFSIMSIGIIVLNMSGCLGWFGMNKYINFGQLQISKTPYDEVVKGKRIAVLGENMNIYKESSLATPFLDWSLSEEVLRNPDYYDNVICIYQSFMSGEPEVIIDLENVIPGIAKRIPFFDESYKKVKSNVYVLKQ